MAKEREVHHLLDSQRLWSKGLGWIDMHLLAAARISGWAFWSVDAALSEAIRALKLRKPSRT